MTRIGDKALEQVREQGFVVIEGFLDADTLAAAQAGFHEDFQPGMNLMRIPRLMAGCGITPVLGSGKALFGLWTSIA